MLTDVVDLLACPVCADGLAADDRVLRCGAGHAFDIARHGYVNLLSGGAGAGTADTAEMARARADFLAAGHFAWLAGLVAARVGDRGDRAGPILDAGAGTGYYLAALLDRQVGSSSSDSSGSAVEVGLAVDLSKHALRRAARAHHRIGAVVADLWRRLPVRDGAVGTIINVFAPRNGAEFYRVLRPGGRLYVVTPTREHLGPLVEALGLLSVDEQKAVRVGNALDGHFVVERRDRHDAEVWLSHTEVGTLVAMGPSAWHVPAERLRERLRGVSDPVAVPLSVEVSVYGRRPVSGESGPSTVRAGVR